ncbi:gamma-aminobutyric acid type B receptor subunit 1-like [Patiria miniata]|uniref:Gamma-aminobutyric acid type B receptor subunit 2 n=1 Tax=Patiria miniata TaxID=46514 RepID=A0A913ZMQ6_PATMI|nr:gamma-aminobutyric acid type B receptor subunit 1-like [Patiria miniata]
MSGAWAAGEAFLPASQLAAQDVNANPDVLPGYQLVIEPLDTKCDGGMATNVMFRGLYNTTTTKIMIIGGGCSLGTEPTAQASHHWNLIQLSYGASSPELSNRDRYPRFFRMFPPESLFNVVWLAVIKEFKWTKVATLHQSVDLFSLAMSDFQEDTKAMGIEILAAESFVDDPGIQVENIKNTGARIIMGNFYADMARRVFCAAYHHQLYGAKYVWFVPGWFEVMWWRKPDDSIDCTVDQMDEVVAHTFQVNIIALPTGRDKPSKMGVTTEAFTQRFHDFVGEGAESLTGYKECALGYDSVWAIAFALEEAEKQLQALDHPRSLSDFTYTDNVTVDILFRILSDMQFEGVSGPVQFDDKGDRICLLDLHQIRDHQSVLVGIVDTTTGTGRDLQLDGYQPIHWPDGAPPRDFILVRKDRQTIKYPVFVTGVVFAMLGIVLACCFLAFNIRFRTKRVIKMSSPNINNLMLIGGMLAYVSIIFLGVDVNIASTDTFVFTCNVKTWLLTIGFSMAFGAMFSKTWRVHKIFTNKTAMKLDLQDSRLFSLIAALVVVDVIILAIWTATDPVKATKMQGTKVVDPDDDDIVYIPIRMICESRNQTYWIGAFYVIDGLLLIFGAFLAWETRKVSIPALNDSKYIGICVYNILILSFIGAPVSFILEEQNALYVLQAALIWLAATLTLCVVFIPKIRMRNDVNPTQSDMVSRVAQSEGSTNVVDTQNEVDMQRELQRLRQENIRLKNKILLGQSSTTLD